MSDDLQFTCEICGKSFDPTPDSMVEWEMGAELVHESKIQGFEMTPEDLKELNAEEMKEMKLTDEMREALLRGEVVKFGGCVCVECQDQMLADQASSEAFGDE